MAYGSSQVTRPILVFLSFLALGHGQVTCSCDPGSQGPAAPLKVQRNWEDLQVSIGFNFLVVVVLGVWWLALLPKMLCRVWPFLRQSFVSCWRSSSRPSDETTKRILQHMEMKRCERLKRIALPACYGLPLLVMHSLSKALKDAFVLGNSLLDSSVVGLNFEGAAISLLSLFTITCPKLSDRLLTLKVMDTFMMVLFLAVGCHTIPCVMFPGELPAAFYTKALNQAVTAQIVLAMCIGNVYKVSLVNFANFCVQVLAIYFMVPVQGLRAFVALEVSDMWAVAERTPLWRVSWNAFFIQLVSIMVAAVLKAEAQAMIGEMEASRSQKTARDLLSVMCDSVVALHKDFTFRGDCSRLMASLLMNVGMSMLDPSRRSLMKYIADEDQDRFKELIEVQDGAGLLHIHLLDSFHRKVPVQVFHTKWIDADNQVNYLLGIQEEREVDHYQSTASVPKLVEPNSHEGSVQCERRPRAAQIADVQRKGGSSSAGSASRVSISEGSNISCLVRLGLQLEILKQSEECQALFGFEETLLPHIDDGTQMMLVDWLTRLHTRKIHQHQGIASFGEVHINGSAGICYKAVLSARFVTVEEVSPLDTTLEITLSAPGIRRATTERELVQAVIRHSSEQRRRLRARAASLPALRPRGGTSL